MRFKEMLTFDDVLLEPKYSRIKSRSEVDISVELPKGFKFAHPFIPSNMKSIISEKLLEDAINYNGLAFLHRFDTIENQVNTIEHLRILTGSSDFLNFVGISLGVKDEDKKNLKTFIDLGIKIVLIDVAHIDSSLGIEMIEYIAIHYPELLLIAGNVATADGAIRAFKAGADVIKVGIGNGTICSTRLEAAAGVPQLSALIEVDRARKQLQKDLDKKLSIMSDGGIRNAGCCVKALCFSDVVMMGGYFAGCPEAAGKEININGQKYKEYHGSSTHKNSRIEGVKGMVKIKEPFCHLIQKLSEGLQSGCSYQNAFNLSELKENPTFIKISNAGLIESGIHDVIIA